MPYFYLFVVLGLKFSGEPPFAAQAMSSMALDSGECLLLPLSTDISEVIGRVEDNFYQTRLQGALVAHWGARPLATTATRHLFRSSCRSCVSKSTAEVVYHTFFQSSGCILARASKQQRPKVAGRSMDNKSSYP